MAARRVVCRLPWGAAEINAPSALCPMFRGSDIPRLFAVAGLVLLAACSDSTAPSATPIQTRPSLAAPAEMPEHVRSAIIVRNVSRTNDSVIVDFDVTPSGGWFVVGYNAVYFPPNAICDPATSGYGPSVWDRPCQPATRRVAIRARAGTGRNLRGWIHFEQDLRFVPSSDPSRWVQIYMWTPDVQRSRPANATELERAWNILWVPGPKERGIDESLQDPTLATQVLWGTGIVTRRVKHFSGYQVGNGFVDESAAGVDSY